MAWSKTPVADELKALLEKEKARIPKDIGDKLEDLANDIETLEYECREE